MTQDGTPKNLPTKLLEAISSPIGGGVVLVLGAGCSSEWPTSLPLSGDLSAQCYEKLLADNVLSGDEVNDPRDLSEVADAVYLKKASQQGRREPFPS